MKVKGLVFISQEIEIKKMFDEIRWSNFVSDISERCPFLKESVFPTSRIPFEEFRMLQDAMIQSFLAVTRNHIGSLASDNRSGQ